MRALEARRGKGTRQPPSSLEAEDAVLGACLLQPEACAQLAAALSPEDFYSPANGHIAGAVLDLHRRGAHVDVLSVATRLGELGLLEAAKGPGHLTALLGDAPSRSSIPTHLATVLERASRRRLIGVAGEVAEMGYDLAEPVENVFAGARSMMDRCEAPDTGEVVPDVEEFVRRTADCQMLVEALLARMDRVCLLAKPGYGKSTLERQLAVMLAAGLHPFRRGVRQPPLRVLYLDVENPPYLVKDHMSRLIARLDRGSRQRVLGQEEQPGDEWDPERLRVCVREEGLDVLRPAGARWFRSQVRSAEPDVLIYGPIYKLARGRPTDEDFAVAVTDFLNDIRTTYGTAMIVETHPPHNVDGGRTPVERPYGASAWERWPDVGVVLKMPDSEQPNLWQLANWRPPRVPRDAWLTYLIRGQEKQWPWIPARSRDEPI